MVFGFNRHSKTMRIPGIGDGMRSTDRKHFYYTAYHNAYKDNRLLLINVGLRERNPKYVSVYLLK